MLKMLVNLNFTTDAPNCTVPYNRSAVKAHIHLKNVDLIKSDYSDVNFLERIALALT